MKIFTIGHSTRTLEELIEILEAYKIKLLIDVRTVPKSRYTPQFNEENLTKELPASGISYKHLAALGGLRSTTKDSTNLGWHNASFRGYADYMQTPEFASGLAELLELASTKTTAIMCAEAVPWKCHRSMIGDALLARNHEVIDIFDTRKSQPEKLTSFAKVDGTQITYPNDS